MEELFEKVEQLRAKANVSYEEAREALNQSNGDVLEAMIYLEKEGKVKTREQVQAEKSIYQQQPQQDGFGKKVEREFKKGCDYTAENYILVTHKGETILRIPLWVGIILLLCSWYFLPLLIIISLCCGCKYQVVKKGYENEATNQNTESNTTI